MSPARPRGHVSLARALSKLGVASRSDAHALILAGRVRIGGRIMRDPALPVIPERIEVAIDDVSQSRSTHRLLLFHKPRGVVTTRRDPEGRRTVFDVIGGAADGLIAVGRLDLASTGLLLLTNDTQWANQMTDPTSRIVRRYVVTARGRVDDDAIGRITMGLDVPGARGETERLVAMRATIHKASSRETHVIVELTEGRNRELRRLFSAIGHELTRVHRVAFGPFELGNLEAERWSSSEFLPVLPQPPL